MRIEPAVTLSVSCDFFRKNLERKKASGSSSRWAALEVDGSIVRVDSLRLREFFVRFRRNQVMPRPPLAVRTWEYFVITIERGSAARRMESGGRLRGIASEVSYENNPRSLYRFRRRLPNFPPGLIYLPRLPRIQRAVTTGDSSPRLRVITVARYASNSGVCSRDFRCSV